jgi:hypothetical protein
MILGVARVSPTRPKRGSPLISLPVAPPRFFRDDRFNASHVPLSRKLSYCLFSKMLWKMTLSGRANKAVVLADKRSAPAKMRQTVKWPSALSALWFRRGPERGQRKRGRVSLVWSLSGPCDRLRAVPRSGRASRPAAGGGRRARRYDRQPGQFKALLKFDPPNRDDLIRRFAILAPAGGQKP